MPYWVGRVLKIIFMTGVLEAYFLLILSLFITAVPVQAQEQLQKIIIAGAQSIVPLAEEFSTQFRKQRPGIEIEIRGGGSNYAVNAARRGEIHIGLSARSLSNAERAGLYVQPFGRDAIILLTHPGNPVRNLTLEQIREIYLGKIKDWSELGGEKKGVVPLTREKGSAIHGLFIEQLFGKGFNGQQKAFILRASKEKILRTIKRIEGSVGYGIVRVEEANSQGVKVLGVGGRFPTSENIRNGLYPFVRPQLLISRENPSGVVGEWMLGFARFADRSGRTGERP